MTSLATAIAHTDTAISTTTPVAIDAMGFSAEELAQADRARISVSGGDAVYAYFPGVVLVAESGHQLPDLGTIIIEGNANINALQFAPIADLTTIYVIVTLEAV